MYIFSVREHKVVTRCQIRRIFGMQYYFKPVSLNSIHLIISIQKEDKRTKKKKKEEEEEISKHGSTESVHEYMNMQQCTVATLPTALISASMDTVIL